MTEFLEGWRMKIEVTERNWTGVYHLIKDGTVVYVGQTTNVFRRIGSHCDKDFDAFEFFPCSVAELDAVEQEHLKRLAPTLNVDGTKKPWRRRPWARANEPGGNERGQWLPGHSPIAGR